MALILNDRVKETTTTTGLGTLTLAGSADTFKPFFLLGVGNTTYYAIVAHSSDNWEVGVGTVGSGTLSRDIVLASSNSNAKVNFPSGVKDVFVTLPANKIVSKDNATGINSGISLADYVDFDTAAAPATAVGRLFWNDQDGTLDLGLKGGSVTIHIGQKQVIRVVNKVGSSLSAANYQCVKISGAQGQRPKVALAQANNDANSADTIGLVNETIADNQEGFVCTGGTITNINTTGSLQGESWNDGDVLYLSGTVAGRLTNVKPAAPIHTVIVGFVIYAHINQGKIFVKVDNGYELDELHNVNITSPSNGQVLTYNNGLWENQTNGSGTVTSVSVVSANGLSGSVANSTTTPAITLSTSVSGLLKGSSGALAAASATDVPELPQSKITNLVSDLAAKAPLASPALTGTPTAPTAAVGTNTTQVATTAFVNAEIANDAPSKTGTGASGTWGVDITGNANTVDGYHVQVDGTGTDPNTIYFKTTGGGIGVDWDDVSNTPTTVSGYGITDAVTTSGNQTVGGTKTFSSTITGSITGNAGTVTNGVYTSGDQTIGGTKTFSSTISGSINGNSNTVDGYHVQVDGTGTDPNTIYFKTTGGGIGVDWDDISNTPTTVAGYGITDAVTTSGDQTIGGTKTFTNDIVASNLKTSANTALSLGLYTGTSFANGGAAIALRGSTAGYNNNGMEFYAGNSERMRLDSAGNVGIGTTSPVSKLEVKGTGFVATSISGDSTSETQLRFNTNTAARVSQQANQSLIFDTNATERMRITSAGNVGIGTSSPTYRLTVANNTFDGVWAESSGTYSFVGLGGYFSGSAGSAQIGYERSTGAFVFGNGSRDVPTERMRIASNGSVGIGRTPESSFALDVGGRLRVINDIGSTYGGDFRLYNSASGATNPAKHFRISPTGTLELINSAYSNVRFQFTDIGEFVAENNITATAFYDVSNSAYYLDPANTGTALNVAGSIVAAGNVTAYSDIRVKDNIEPIHNALDKLVQINGVTYTRTDLEDKERRYGGVIAQEVESVMPEAVFDDGKVKAVDYNATIGLLIEAVKEQQGQINELKLTIEQLKGS